MLFQKMTEADMTEYLQNLGALEEGILRERNELMKQVESLEEAIERNTFRNSDVSSGLRTIISEDTRDKVFHILQKAYRSIEQEIEQATHELWEVDKKEQKMRTVKKCLARLPYCQREILEDLYVKGIDWQDYAEKHALSRATVFRARKRALDNLLVLYNDSYGSEKGEEGKPDNELVHAE